MFTLKERLMDNHLSSTYQERMNQTVRAKLEAVLPHLEPGMKLLDFGSGFSPEFIHQIEKRGVIYHAYDISPTVQRQLTVNGTTCVTDLSDKVEYYDVIFASSVFHELVSYKTESECTTIVRNLMNTLKQYGKIIIRDWDFPIQIDNEETRKVVPFRMEKLVEIRQWCDALLENKIIEWFEIDTKKYTVTATEFDMLQIMFHVTWGLDAIERESREIYTSMITAYNIVDNSTEPDTVVFDTKYEEYDDTYLPHLQKYFLIDELPQHTKTVLTLMKIPKIR
jgi:hypothetical protein